VKPQSAVNSADCFKVLGSSYAKVGQDSVSALGALAYFSAFTFATFAGFGYARARKSFHLDGNRHVRMTLWLLFVQAFRLHAFCRYCLFSAALVFLLTGWWWRVPVAENTRELIL